MKNLLIVLVCLAILSSCKKSDTGPSVVGKWYAKKIIWTLYTSQGEHTITDSVTRSENNFLLLNSNGTAENHILLSNNSRITATGITYTVSGNTLQMVDNNGNKSAINIASSTSNSLVLTGGIAVWTNGLVGGIEYGK